MIPIRGATVTDYAKKVADLTEELRVAKEEVNRKVAIAIYSAMNQLKQPMECGHPAACMVTRPFECDGLKGLDDLCSACESERAAVEDLLL